MLVVSCLIFQCAFSSTVAAGCLNACWWSPRIWFLSVLNCTSLQTLLAHHQTGSSFGLSHTILPTCFVSCTWSLVVICWYHGITIQFSLFVFRLVYFYMCRNFFCFFKGYCADSTLLCFNPSTVSKWLLWEALSEYWELLPIRITITSRFLAALNELAHIQLKSAVLYLYCSLNWGIMK